jgi:hypothetical protein
MFYQLDLVRERLHELFQRSGGAVSATTMCCLLFAVSKWRYFLAFNFWFGSAFLALLFVSFRL